MLKRYNFCYFVLISLNFIELHADSASQLNEEILRVDCYLDPFYSDHPRPMRVTMRHIEGNGIGYNQGYSTIEGFLTPWKGGSWVPFLDLRGHVFNGGQLAANAGLGARYLTDSRVWGMNSYYDYRHTSHQHYNQVSVGVESFGEIWDFRVNGYCPVGEKRSSFFGIKFEEFKGHWMILSLKREFAMGGANAEVAAHVDCFKKFPLYFAAGPYYLKGQGKTAWGGELRAAVDIFDYVRIEGNTSYDTIFRWIGQGQLSLIIPFGKRRVVKQVGRNFCSADLTLEKRAMQNVDRSEIIPVDRERKKSTAIDPVTGNPYFFWFVNGSGHSDGTFESPYHELSTAEEYSRPGDVIYVFPGNGSSYDMNGSSGGLLMKDNQKLFGSGTLHKLDTQYGGITIPQFTKNLPTVTNTSTNMSGSPTAVITLANTCEVAGMHITGTDVGFGIVSAGLLASGVAGGIVRDNIINVTSQNTGIYGIAMINSGDEAAVSIFNNEISGIDTYTSSFGYSFGIWVRNFGSGATLSLSNNSISNIDNHASVLGGDSFAIFAENGDTGAAVFSILNNNISNINNHLSGSGTGYSLGIYVENMGTKPAIFSVLNNSVSNIDNYGDGTGYSYGIWGRNFSTEAATFSISNNSVSNIDNHALGDDDSTGIYVENGVTGAVTFSLSNNEISSIDNHTSGNGNSYGIFTGNVNTSAAFSLLNNRVSSIDNHASGSGNSYGILTQIIAAGTGCSFFDNRISNIDNQASGGGISYGIFAENLLTGATLSLLNNRVSEVSNNGILLVNFPSGDICVTLTDNSAPPSIQLINEVGGTFILDLSSRNNWPVPIETGSINEGTCSP